MLLQLTAKEVEGIQEIVTLAKRMGHHSFEVKRTWLEGLLADRGTMQVQINSLEMALGDCIDSKKKKR